MQEKEKCQVIFINSRYLPNEVTLIHLDELQREISHCNWRIEQESNSKFELILRKQKLANMLRNKIELLD